MTLNVKCACNPKWVLSDFFQPIFNQRPEATSGADSSEEDGQWKDVASGVVSH
jgi:hypothetical protein